MTDDSLLPVDLPSVQRKKVSAAFDGGLISSDGGLVLLREAERSLRLVAAGGHRNAAARPSPAAGVLGVEPRKRVRRRRPRPARGLRLPPGERPRSESRSDPSRSRQRRGARARPDATRRDALVGGRDAASKLPLTVTHARPLSRRASSIPWIPIRPIA